MRFILDSGATSHLVNEERFLTACVEVNSAKRFTSLDVKSVGNLYVKNERGREFVMCDVKFAPNLIANLLSVRKLSSVEFGEDVIIRDSNNKLVTKAYERDDRLFEVKFCVSKREEDSAILTIDNEKVVWHRRFGHASSDLLSKVGNSIT